MVIGFYGVDMVDVVSYVEEDINIEFVSVIICY